MGQVMKVLEPIWNTKTETASRVRGRMENVLDWATVRGYRTGDNPARWRGHLDHLFPERGRVARVEHHAALAYTEIAGFMVDLRKQSGLAAGALEFAVLTAARTSEVLAATWDESDLDAAVWTIRATRMKARKEHRVPLSLPAVAILRKLHDARHSTFVFPGGKHGKSLSNMAMTAVLRRMKPGDLTVHGFRSTFRDWAAERTRFPREVAEQALAHTLPDKVEAAYLRSDLFDRRRRLMDDWAAFCNQPHATRNVVPIRPA